MRIPKNKKRNWETICQLRDRHFRLAVSLTDDPDFLAELQERWPELFMKGEDEGPLKIPLSALVRATLESMHEEGYEGNPYLNLYLPGDYFPDPFLPGSSGEMTHLSLPGAWGWDSEGFEWEHDVPQSVLQQLQNKRPTEPLLVEYTGAAYLVTHLVSNFHPDGTIDMKLREEGDYRRVVLTPLECVDLNA